MGVLRLDHQRTFWKHSTTNELFQSACSCIYHSWTSRHVKTRLIGGIADQNEVSWLVLTTGHAAQAFSLETFHLLKLSLHNVIGKRREATEATRRWSPRISIRRNRPSKRC